VCIVYVVYASRALSHDVHVLEVRVLQAAVGVVLQPDVGVHLASVPLEVGEQPCHLRGVWGRTRKIRGGGSGGETWGRGN
jgi:hypothetical protein